MSLLKEKFYQLCNTPSDINYNIYYYKLLNLYPTIRK